MSTMSNPRISVILPVDNNERFLEEAIESILKQTYADFELIVIIEFGSSAKSMDIVDSYDDSRINVIKNGHRLGLARSLNLGLKLAKGEYIARMDADDVSDSSRFALQVDYLDHNPKVAVCGANVITIDGDGKAIERVKYPLEPLVVKWSMFLSCAIGHSSIMARKEALQAKGGYREDARQAEDYDLWLRLLGGYGVANLPQFIHKRRRHDSNASISKRDELKTCASSYLKESVDNYLDKSVSMNSVRNILFADRLCNKAEAIQSMDVLWALLEAFIRKESPNEKERKAILEQYDFCAGNIIGSVIASRPTRILPLLVESRPIAKQFSTRKGLIDIFRASAWRFKLNRRGTEWD